MSTAQLVERLVPRAALKEDVVHGPRSLLYVVGRWQKDASGRVVLVKLDAHCHVLDV